MSPRGAAKTTTTACAERVLAAVVARTLGEGPRTAQDGAKSPEEMGGQRSSTGPTDVSRAAFAPRWPEASHDYDTPSTTPPEPRHTGTHPPVTMKTAPPTAITGAVNDKRPA